MTQDNWISVKDRLPDADTDVLAMVDKKKLDGAIVKQMHVGHYVPTFNNWVVGNFFAWDIGSVTHWQPLPEPPNP